MSLELSDLTVNSDNSDIEFDENKCINIDIEPTYSGNRDDEKLIISYEVDDNNNVSISNSPKTNFETDEESIEEEICFSKEGDEVLESFILTVTAHLDSDEEFKIARYVLVSIYV